LRLLLVGYKISDKIHREVCRAAVVGVFNLINILELISKGLNDKALVEQQLVGQHQLTLLGARVLLHTVATGSKSIYSKLRDTRYLKLSEEEDKQLQAIEHQ
jgi:hypothetical protein